MIRNVAAVVALLALSACTVDSRGEPAASPPAPRAATLSTTASLPTPAVRIVSWNPEFLWDGEEPEDGSRDVQFPWRGNAALAGRRIAAVAETLAPLDADIVVLIELEGRHILERLAASPPLAGRGYQVAFVPGKDTFTGQDVGILSRLPVRRTDRTNARATVGNVSLSVSKNLIAELALPDGACLTVMAIHLLSRAEDPGRAASREAQAEVVREAAVAERTAGCHLVVAGDFNDYDPDVETQPKRTPVSSVLKRIKAMDPAMADDDLINALGAIPTVAERYSNRWDRDRDGQIELPAEGSLIDHVLVSPSLKVASAAMARPQLDGQPLSDHDAVVVVVSPAPAPSQ